MWYHRYYEHATVRLQHGLTYSIVLLKMLQLGPLKHSSLTKLYLMGKWRRVFEWILNDEQNWEPQNLRGHFHGYPAFPIAQNMSWHQRSPTRAPIIITAQCPTFHFGDSTSNLSFGFLNQDQQNIHSVHLPITLHISGDDHTVHPDEDCSSSFCYINLKVRVRKL